MCVWSRFELQERTCKLMYKLINSALVKKQWSLHTMEPLSTEYGHLPIVATPLKQTYYCYGPD